jgi:GTPase SAR1 family protein
MSQKKVSNLIAQLIEDAISALSYQQETTALGTQLDTLQLQNKLKHKFTLVVIGQMKAGKSTLLNALIERDIAPVGVTECTATVNRFLFDVHTDKANTFRVHWNNGEIEDLPINEIDHWIGRESNVYETEKLDFFSNTPFLEHVNIIDTPGLRSTINHHEASARSVIDFSSTADRIEQLEKASDTERELADAIIYVLNPIAKQNDESMLSLFAEQTRLPGVRAYNSIAVVQKWEQRWDDPSQDYIEDVHKKCLKLKQQLEGKVAEVIPVSGLLARSLFWLSDKSFENLLLLATSSLTVITELTLNEDYFLKDKINDALLSTEERQILHSEIFNAINATIEEKSANAVTWTLISFLLKLAYKEKITNINDFKTCIRELSGIDQLLTILNDRFFKRAAQIKAGSTLYRVLEPSDKGIHRLQKLIADRTVIERQEEKVLQLLKNKIISDKELEPIYHYLVQNVGAIKDSLVATKNYQKQLWGIKSQIHQFLDNMDLDLRGLEFLEKRARDIQFSDSEKSELWSLFGASDLSIESRLGAPKDRLPKKDDLHILASNKLKYWATKSQSTIGIEDRICELAQKRLKLILDELEEE